MNNELFSQVSLIFYDFKENEVQKIRQEKMHLYPARNDDLQVGNKLLKYYFFFNFLFFFAFAILLFPPHGKVCTSLKKLSVKGKVKK
jgi:hypothetical protein